MGRTVEKSRQGGLRVVAVFEGASGTTAYVPALVRL